VTETLKEEDLELASFGKVDDEQIQSFESSIEDLTNFFKNEAKFVEDEKYCKTHLLLKKNQIIGFFTLSAFSIDKESGIPDLKKIKGIDKFPCVMIGRLSTSKEKEGMGYGSLLLSLILGMTFEIEEQIGIRFLITNAQNKEAQKWWEKKEFKIIPKKKYSDREKPFLFFDLKKAKEQMGNQY